MKGLGFFCWFWLVFFFFFSIRQHLPQHGQKAVAQLRHLADGRLVRLAGRAPQHVALARAPRALGRNGVVERVVELLVVQVVGVAGRRFVVVDAEFLEVGLFFFLKY